ncbi:MAG: protein kinase [Planctomycetota bacterium]
MTEHQSTSHVGASNMASLLRLGLSTPSDEAVSHPGLQAAQDSGFMLSHRHSLGGTAEIWSGFDRTTMRRVVIKVVRLDRGVSGSMLIHEGRVLGELGRVTGVEPLSCLGSEDDAFLVLPLILGDPLDVFCRKADSDTARRVISKALAKITEIHNAGFIHGDLKPEHILVLEDEDVAIIDFGLAVGRNTAPPVGGWQRHAGFTAEFAAPELREKAVLPTVRSDVFAIGALLRQLAETQAGSLRTCLRAVANHCTRHDPATRPATAGEVHQIWRMWWGRRLRFRRTAGFAVVLLAISLLGFTVISPSGRATDSTFLSPDSTSQMAPLITAFHALDSDPLAVTFQAAPKVPEHVPILQTPLSENGVVAYLAASGLVVRSDREGVQATPLGLRSQLSWSDDQRLVGITDEGMIFDFEDGWPIQIGVSVSEPKAVDWAGRELPLVWSHRAGQLVASAREGEAVTPLAEAWHAMPIEGSQSGWLLIDRAQFGSFSARTFGLPDWATVRHRLGRGRQPTSALLLTHPPRLLIGAMDGSIDIVSATTEAERATIDAMDGSVLSMVQIPETRCVIAGGSRIALVDLDEKRVLLRRHPRHRSMLSDLRVIREPGTILVELALFEGIERWRLRIDDTLLP